MDSPISSILKSFSYSDRVFTKGIKQRALNISIDSDVILKTESESFSILSEYMKVDRGILDMISFCRVQVPINAHICVSNNKDMVKVLDNVMSTGFTVNSCISERESNLKSSGLGKILNIVKILSSFPERRHVFIISSIEELIFLEYVQDLIQDRDSRIPIFFTKSKLYKRWSSTIDLHELKRVRVTIDAIFLKSDALKDVSQLRTYLFGNDSKVCVFDNYLDMAISFVTSNTLSKDKFIYFLKYAHDHFGESVEDILSTITPLIEARILQNEDLTIFKNHKILPIKKKKNWLVNYLIKENPDFTQGLIKCYYDTVEGEKEK